jgi:hypothetical protein
MRDSELVAEPKGGLATACGTPSPHVPHTQTLLADYGITRHPSLIARAQRYRKYIAEKQKRKAKRF